jgi:hypothetical protein
VALSQATFGGHEQAVRVRRLRARHGVPWPWRYVKRSQPRHVGVGITAPPRCDERTEYDEEQNTKSLPVMGASLLISGAMILSKLRPKVEQILTAPRDCFACRSRFVPFGGVENLVTTTGHIRSRSRSGRSTSGRTGRDRCGMSVAPATSTRSLTGSGPPRSVGTRVVVGFQRFITHRAVRWPPTCVEGERRGKPHRGQAGIGQVLAASPVRASRRAGQGRPSRPGCCGVFRGGR